MADDLREAAKAVVYAWEYDRDALPAMIDELDRVSRDPAEWSEEFPREFPEVGG